MEKRVKDQTINNTAKIICPECRRITNHKIVASYDINGSKIFPDGYDIGWETHYQIVECQGCETISFMSYSMNSEDYEPDGEGGLQPVSHQNLYPSRNANTLSRKRFVGAPSTIRRIYREIIGAYNQELYTLCAGGLRAAIEGICSNKKIVGGKVIKKTKDGATKEKILKTIEGKIEGLHQSGYLSKQHAEFLHQHRYLGNSALHELEAPSAPKLKIAIGIVEHTIENIYVQ